MQPSHAYAWDQRTRKPPNAMFTQAFLQIIWWRERPPKCPTAGERANDLRPSPGAQTDGVRAHPGERGPRSGRPETPRSLDAGRRVADARLPRLPPGASIRLTSWEGRSPDSKWIIGAGDSGDWTTAQVPPAVGGGEGGDTF